LTPERVNHTIPAFEQMAQIRVSIRSDDNIFSDGLRRIIATDASLVRVALPPDMPIEAALASAATDVLLLDVRIENAHELCERLQKADHHPSVILVQVPVDAAAATHALATGARGILQHSAKPEDVPMAIHTVARGQVWAPRHIIVAAWLQTLNATAGKRDTRPNIAAHLTSRELEVLHHAAAGLGNRELAERLAISEATVKVHLTRVFQKLGLRGRARLAAIYHDVH
jgi:DNA-binding NarL/FixJ family response regulator